MRRDRNAKIELVDIFPKVQQEMIARFALDNLLGHPLSAGTATETQWLEFFRLYLPGRYAASGAFIISADGRRSRQIDIAIYDRLYSPLLFPHPSGLHLPVESIYAVFEVKQSLNRAALADAAGKIATVRTLRRTSAPFISAGSPHAALPPREILAGVLAVRSVWTRAFRKKLAPLVGALPAEQRVDLGCVLLGGAFELLPASGGCSLRFSSPEEALVFFFIRLLERLRALGTAPAANLMAYARSLESFRQYPGSQDEP